MILMIRIKKLKENGKTIYPATIWNAVMDPETKASLKETIDIIQQFIVAIGQALESIDAKTLNGHGIVTAGELDPKNKIPVVGTDGVMEIGRYLDFHMDGSKEDYNIRLRCDTTGKYQLYLPAKTGTVALTSDIPDIPDTNYVYGCFDSVDTYVDLSTLPKSTWSSQAPIYFVSEDTVYQRFCFFLNYHFDSDNNTVSAYFVANDLDGAGIGLYYFENKKATSNNVRFDFKAI